MYDIVVMGSINMDIVVSCKTFPKSGDNIFCNSIQMVPGGKGRNQVISARHFGKDVCFVGCVGDDSSGQELRRSLIEGGIDDRFLMTTSDQETGSCVAIVESTGANTLLVQPGANFCFGEKEIVEAMKNIEGKIFLLQMETSHESIKTAMKIAREKGMYVILDPAPVDGIQTDVFPLADLIVPNSNETHFICGINPTDEASAIEAAKKIHAMGVRDVIVKMGDLGSVIYSNDTATFVPSIKVKAVNTVGAGDCFAGAIANKLIESNDLVAAVRFATVASGLKVSNNRYPTLEEINAYRAQSI